MGSVSRDIYKREREFRHLTLSDENVVKYLIKHRNKVDLSYGANTNIDINQAGELFDFNQEIIVLYASLDNLVEKYLTDKQKKLLALFYKGNTVGDIVKYHNYDRVAVHKMFNRIVESIVKNNNEEWYYVMKKNGKAR